MGLLILSWAARFLVLEIVTVVGSGPVFLHSGHLSLRRVRLGHRGDSLLTVMLVPILKGSEATTNIAPL